MSKIIIFTDLDGSLLNHDDYSYEAALPLLELLRSRNVPLILCSSKTPAEIAVLHNEIHNTHPYICENGSVVVLPEAFFNAIGPLTTEYSRVGTNIYSYFGSRRSDILNVLSGLRAQYQFLGFAQMSTEDIMEHTGLDKASAERAAQRDASEPVVWQDSEARLSEFEQELVYNDLRIVKGGRFYHVMGNADKGKAVASLIKTYQKFFNAEVYSIALGDSPNDLDMLKTVSVPIVIPAFNGKHMSIHDRENVVYAPQPGAKGWAIALQEVIDDIVQST